MRGASFEQREFIGKVVVDGLTLYARPFGYVGYGRLRRSIGPVQLKSCFDDPLARLLVALGSGLQVVLPSLATSRHCVGISPFSLDSLSNYRVTCR